jgi:hypothetical protein
LHNRIGFGLLNLCQNTFRLLHPFETATGSVPCSDIVFNRFKKVSARELTRVGNNTFRNCVELIEVNFPKVTAVGDNAFLDAPPLRRLIYRKRCPLVSRFPEL